ncbi:MAG: hypothetical protein WA139_00740 [Candidatus Aenigmatarchaeota archaeon]
MINSIMKKINQIHFGFYTLIFCVLLLSFIFFFLANYLGYIKTETLIAGLIIQSFGSIFTILVVQKILIIRDNERWMTINTYVYNFLFSKIYVFIEELIEILNIEIKFNQQPKIKRLGIEYFNPNFFNESLGKYEKVLKELSEESESVFLESIKTWNHEKFRIFSNVLDDFYKEINKLLVDYPHNIPPEILKHIILVREELRGRSNFAKTLANSGKKLDGLREFLRIEVKYISKLFKNLYELRKILKPQQ